MLSARTLRLAKKWQNPSKAQEKHVGYGYIITAVDDCVNADLLAITLRIEHIDPSLIREVFPPSDRNTKTIISHKTDSAQGSREDMNHACPNSRLGTSPLTEPTWRGRL